jgi:hypothetical protein
MTTTLFENLPTILTAVSTAIIAVFTVVLACVGRLQTKITRVVEAPIPTISSIKLVAYSDSSGPSVVDPVPPGPIPQFCRVLPQINNLGRTPLNVTRFCITWVVSPDLPETPSYDKIIFDLKLRLGPNQSTWLRTDPKGDIELTDVEKQLITFRRGFLWVFGFLSYSHLLGDTYSVGFLARWDLIAGFLFEARPNYTYERKG